MTKQEYNEWEGWLNEATYHAAIVVFNDTSVLKRIDDQLKNNCLLGPTGLTNYITIPSHLGSKDVDAWGIQWQRLNDLLEDGKITQESFEKLKPKFNSAGSDCRSRRFNLLGAAGFDHNNDPFFDYAATFSLPQIVNNPQPQEQETPFTMKVETKYFVNGTDIVSYSIDQKVALIQKTECQIADLKLVKTQSKMVATEIQKLEDFLAQIVELFDKE
jgi:hypothetical protein